MSIVIGLTGGIATGKSTAADMLRQLGVPVFCADRAVHTLLRGDAFENVAKRFPSAVKAKQIDRKKLASIIYKDDAERKALEAILHPLVRQEELTFIRHMRVARHPLVVLDIPLLFETGAEQLCDAVWVVHCPAFLQHQRAFTRPKMTEAIYQSILARQMPAIEKIRRADAVIHSGIGKGAMMRQLQRYMKEFINA